MARGFWIALVALAGPALAAAAPSPTIPFTFDDSRLWVPVRIGNGASIHQFILDTGAASIVLDADLAIRHGLALVAVGDATGAGGGRTAVGRVDRVALRVGSVALKPPSLSTSPLEVLLAGPTGHHAPGIIGAQFFKEHVVEIDFERGLLRLHDPAAFYYRGSGVIVPLRFFEGLPMTTGALTAADGTRLSLRLLVDLGAKSTLLIAEPFIARTDLRHAFPNVVEEPLGAGLGGPTRYAFARARSLSVGRAALSRPVVGLSVGGVLKSDWYDGLLGADFLSHYRVIFDYARKRMILEARRSPPRVAFDRSGLSVRVDGPDLDRLWVTEIVRGSPADQAGLQPGDRIERVDGRAAPVTLSGMRGLLRGESGRPLVIGYRRAGQAGLARLVLRDLL